MDFNDLRARAAELNRSTIAGDLANAYRLLLDLSAEEASRVLLLAGYAVVGPNDRRFWAHAQGGIAAACQHQVGGTALSVLELRSWVA